MGTVEIIGDKMSYFENKNYKKSYITKYTKEQAGQAIVDGLIEITGVKQPEEVSAKFLSQSRYETGHFAYCYNNNWGNVKKNPERGSFHMIRCNEIINGECIWFDPPHIQTCFASYSTQKEGAMKWMELILTDDRYKRAKKSVLDPSESAYDFAWTLSECGYYTAEKHHYSLSVQSIYPSSLEAILSLDNKISKNTLRKLMLTEPHMRGEDVKEWQTKLIECGFAVNITGEFDEVTKDCTVNLQSRCGLTPDGIVGGDTRSASKEIKSFKRIIKNQKPFMSGFDIAGWQIGLKKCGLNVNVDGTFGPHSELVTKEFQKINGLDVTGVVDGKSMEKMLEKILAFQTH